MTPEQLEAIKARNAARTQGKWTADEFAMANDSPVRVGTTDGSPLYYHRSATICQCFTNHNDDRPKGEPLVGPIQAERNAKFIAHASEDIPALISALEAEQEKVKRLEEALTWYGEQARLCRLIHSEGDDGRHALAKDGGTLARATLTEGK